jgi:hypothetical protein
LVSCTHEDADTNTTDESTTDALTTTEAAETEAPKAEKLILVQDKKTDFRVIRSEEASGYALDTATIVYRKLSGELSPDFRFASDFRSPLEPDPTTAHEILLFSTERAESVAAMADLTFEGYIIRVTEHKVVIVGSSPASCNEALYCFFDQIIPEHTENGVIALPVGLEVKTECESKPLDIRAAIAEGKTIGADFELLFAYKGSGGFSTAQGVATDGTHAYVVMKKANGKNETDRIVKINMATWEIVKESEELPLDHGNDMTYDPINNRLVVVNMLNGILTIVDPEALTIVEQATLTFGTWGAGYIDGTEQYVFLAGLGLTVTDTDFNVIRSSPLKGAEGYTGQGMDADAQFAYVPLSPNAGKARISFRSTIFPRANISASSPSEQRWNPNPCSTSGTNIIFTSMTAAQRSQSLCFTSNSNKPRFRINT